MSRHASSDGADGDAGPEQLQAHRERLAELARSVRAAVKEWTEVDGEGVTELCDVLVEFLDGTAPEHLLELDRDVRRGSPSATVYVGAVSGVAAAMERLLTAARSPVATEPGTNLGTPTVLRTPVADVLEQCDRLVGALRVLVGRGHPRDPWTGQARRLTNDLAGALATARAHLVRCGILQRDDDAAAVAPDPGSGAARLGAVLDRKASRERRLAEALRVGAVVVYLAIAVLASTVFWRYPVDTAALALDLAKLTMIASLALLAAYLQKESRAQRAAADRLWELEVQFRSVHALFDPAEAREQHLAVWQKFLAGVPVSEAGSASGDDLATLLQRLVDLVKSVGSLGR